MWCVVSGMVAAVAFGLLPAGVSLRRCGAAASPAGAASPCARARLPALPVQSESLVVAARRAAWLWQRHDFLALLDRATGVMLYLPGAEPSAPLRPAQAAQLLQAFAGGAEELGVEVTVVRAVEPDRAYAEAQRTYVVRGTSVPRTQSLYFGWRRSGAGYVLVEVRALP